MTLINESDFICEYNVHFSNYHYYLKQEFQDQIYKQFFEFNFNAARIEIHPNLVYPDVIGLKYNYRV